MVSKHFLKNFLCNARDDSDHTKTAGEGVEDKAFRPIFPNIDEHQPTCDMSG